MIKFSIITATFNRVKKLETLCANLIAQQNFLKFEIEWILIVEKNDFKTINFIKKLKKINYKIIFNKSPKKFSSLIPQGIKAVTGDYIVIIPDDDGLYSNALTIVADKIKFNRGPQFIVGYADYVDSKKKKIRQFITYLKIIFLNINSRLLFGFVNYYMCPTVFVKKTVLSKIKFFPSEYSDINDYMTWLQIRNLYKPLIVKKKVAYVSFEKGTITYSFNLKKYFFLWKIYLTSNNFFFLFPLKFLFSIFLLLTNWVYRSIIFFK
jgi:hypothetical protein